MANRPTTNSGSQSNASSPTPALPPHAYLHQHRKQVLMLRCLATKGRATTTDPVLNFLEQLGDNGVIWKVLSFWPPPP